MTSDSDRTRPRRRFAGALTLALVVGGLAMPSSALAQEPTTPAAEPTAADKATARTLVALAKTKSKSGDHTGALEALLQAHRIMQVPTTALLLAKAHETLGQLVEAHDLLVQITLMPTQRKEPAAFGKARKTAKARVEEIAARIPSLVTVVEASDGGTLEDVKVVVDGTELSGVTATLPRQVNPGEHRVSASAKNHRADPVTVTVVEKESKPVRVVLIPLPPPPPPEPVAPLPPPLAEDPIPLVTPPVVPPPVTLPPPDRAERASSKPWVVWTSWGVGAAGVLAGSVTGGLSLAAASNASDLCPSKTNCSEAARPDYDRSIALANVSNVAFAVGGLGAIVGTVSFFVMPGSIVGSPAAPRTASWRIEPFVSPTGFGIAGSF